MATYHYTAVTSQGKKTHGVLEGESARHIRQSLLEKNLIATKVTLQQVGFRRAISTKSLTNITRDLATLAEAGVTIEKALAVSAGHTTSAREKTLLLNIRSQILQGHSFAESLRLSNVFPEAFSTIVEIGEASGRLSQVLAQMADYMERVQASRNKLLLIMVYPTVLIALSLSILIFMLTYVLPDVIGVFVQSGKELPLLTSIMLSISSFLTSYGWLLLALLAGGLVLGRRYLSQPEPREKWDRAILRLPLIGGIIRLSNTASFASSLNLLYKNGIPLVDGMEKSQNALSNHCFRQHVAETCIKMKEGDSLLTALSNVTEPTFEEKFVLLLGSGEANGTLNRVLEVMTRSYADTLEQRTAYMIKLFEPAVTIIMGLLIVMIVFAILQPVMSLNQMVM